LHRNTGVGRLARWRQTRGQTGTNSQNFIQHKHATDTHQPGKEALVDRGKDGETKTHEEEKTRTAYPGVADRERCARCGSSGNRCCCKMVTWLDYEKELCVVQRLLLHMTTIVIKLPVSVTIPTHRTVSDRQQTPTGGRTISLFDALTNLHHSYKASETFVGDESATNSEEGSS